jgi:hypothetical protein
VNGTVDVITDESVDAMVDATVDAEVDVSVDAEVDESVDVTVEDITDATAVLPVDGDDDSPYAADDDVATELVAEEAGDDEITIVDASTAVHAQSIVSAEAADDELTDDDLADDEVIVFAVAPIVRHTVYTARYRYVIKGPERGKWETNVKAEAEAPLITVETVVRGVQRRAGEESEIIRFTGAQIARALRLTPR